MIRENFTRVLSSTVLRKQRLIILKRNNMLSQSTYAFKFKFEFLIAHNGYNIIMA